MKTTHTPAPTGHTKLPWKAVGSLVEGPPDWPVPLIIATCSLTQKTGEPKANAQLIVTACNNYDSLRESHARLLEALKDLIFAAENADETGYVTDTGFIDRDSIYKEAHAAIASAQLTKAWKEGNLCPDCGKSRDIFQPQCPRHDSP